MQVLDHKAEPFTTSSSWGTLQRKCACEETAGAAGKCGNCQKNRLQGVPILPKLQINDPGDVYEQEADRIANQVMRMPEPQEQDMITGSPGLPVVQRKVAGGSSGMGVAPLLVQDVLASSGQPLDASTRSFFESRLGHDFSHVRVHADEAADQSAAAVSARAYTVGKDLVFGAEQYKPSSSEGRRLIGHELTHVVQQSAQPSMTSHLQRYPVFPDESCESEKVQDKISEIVDDALILVRNAKEKLLEPESIAGLLRRFFSVEPDDAVAVFLIKENIEKLERKLAGPVDSYCKTPRTFRKEGYKSPPRAYAELDPETSRATLDSAVVYNRNIFRLTGLTTRRQVVNTTIHEYAHLAGIGHGEADRGAPISNKTSIKVRGLNTDQAINSAEVTMRFVRAVN